MSSSFADIRQRKLILATFAQALAEDHNCPGSAGTSGEWSYFLLLRWRTTAIAALMLLPTVVMSATRTGSDIGTLLKTIRALNS
jgi:hypothetical protein